MSAGEPVSVAVGAPTLRILHFSDVHVQLPVLSTPALELLGKRFLAGLNLWMVRGKLFAATTQKLSELAAFTRAEHVTLAICTGDYTAIGTDGEHADARRRIEELRAAAELGLCTVPGNHDVYLPDTLRAGRFEKHFGDLMHSDLLEYVVDGAYPFVRLVGDGLAVVGINSARPNPSPFASSGRVPDVQLAALARLLDDPRLARRRVIVMTHYGILRADGKPDSKHHGLDNAAALLAVCARPNVLLVHGHIHHRYSHPAAPGRPWLFCAGSATHRGREGFWLYESQGTALRAIPGAYENGAYVLREAEAIRLPAL